MPKKGEKRQKAGGVSAPSAPTLSLPTNYFWEAKRVDIESQMIYGRRWVVSLTMIKAEAETRGLPLTPENFFHMVEYLRKAFDAGCEGVELPSHITPHWRTKPLRRAA